MQTKKFQKVIDGALDFVAKNESSAEDNNEISVEDFGKQVHALHQSLQRAREDYAKKLSSLEEIA